MNIPLLQRRLPKSFVKLRPQTHINKYPYDVPLIAGLHVAVKHRGVDLYRDVDFSFGGSATLSMLSHQSIELGYQFLVTSVPLHPNIISVSCTTDYVQDYAHFGFQFERLVTSKKWADLHDKCQVKHMHILQVAEHRVLITAESDAVQDGQVVEIKVSNPIYWGASVMFQMISNGSTILYFGDKTPELSLQSVQIQSLPLVMDGLNNQNCCGNGK